MLRHTDLFGLNRAVRDIRALVYHGDVVTSVGLIPWPSALVSLLAWRSSVREWKSKGGTRPT